jgi:hypothetical protein
LHKLYERLENKTVKRKETFDATLQVLKDEIAALREERKQFLALIERLTLK